MLCANVKDQRVSLTFSGDMQTGEDSYDAGVFTHAINQPDIALSSCDVVRASYIKSHQ